MAGGGDSVWRCGGGAAGKGGINSSRVILRGERLWLEGDDECILSLVEVDELEGSSVGLAVMQKERQGGNRRALRRSRLAGGEQKLQAVREGERTPSEWKMESVMVENAGNPCP